MAQTQVHIYFASQSGTAEYFAEELRDEAAEHDIDAEVIDLVTFRPEEFASCKIAVLVVSTYGDGDPPDNAVAFHRWASDPNNSGALQGQRFCVMSLGDMNYIMFCNFGVMTDQNLERLGAKRIYQRGMGDAGSDIMADFRKWKSDGLWDCLQKAITEVKQEDLNLGKVQKPLSAPGLSHKNLYIFYGHEEVGGAAKHVCDELVAHLCEEALPMPKQPQSLFDRKAVSNIQKLPKGVLVVFVIDCNPEGLCAAGRKLRRNLQLELDANSLLAKDLHYAFLAVATSKCATSAAALRPAIEENSTQIQEALNRVGMKPVVDAMPQYVDAGVECVAPVVKEVCSVLTQVAITTKAAPGSAVLKMAEVPAELTTGVQGEPPMGEPSDVLARFYFEADRAKILKVRELRQIPNAAEGSSTAEIEIEAVGGLSNYTLGGTLSLLPENDPADVLAMLPILGLSKSDLGKSITFVSADGSNAKIKQPFPTPCTLNEALTLYCDLNRPPTRKSLMALHKQMKNEAAREHVGEFLKNDEALKLLHTAPFYCKMHHFWSMLRVRNLDLNEFLVHCPRQKAREYTIASSPKITPERITLCVSLTSNEVPNVASTVQQLCNHGCLPIDTKVPFTNSGHFFGMCSQWLTTRLQVGHTVLAKQRPSNFHLPEQDVPIVMVGSGAGISPFKGFWEELRRGPQSAPAALFFGCRHPDKDWLFKEEMNRAVKMMGCSALARVQIGPKRPLAYLFPAFSRPEDGKGGQYVQDQVRAQGISVKHWMEKMGGFFFICGSVAMGKSVLDALAEVLDGGHETVEALRKEGRIVAELWG